jgi:hypothetical protein
MSMANNQIHFPSIYLFLPSFRGKDNGARRMNWGEMAVIVRLGGGGGNGIWLGWWGECRVGDGLGRDRLLLLSSAVCAVPAFPPVRLPFLLPPTPFMAISC